MSDIIGGKNKDILNKFVVLSIKTVQANKQYNAHIIW